MIQHLSKLIKNIIIPNQHKVILGRWKLKHNNEHFYNPDPGYPNNYLKNKN